MAGEPGVDFGADQRVRDRVEEVVDLDVIVEVDARTPPFRELPIVGGQGGEGVALDCLAARRRKSGPCARGRRSSPAKLASRSPRRR